MTTLLKDLRYAARVLRRSPGFALTAVLTLALGIGANSAIFSVVNATLLRPLPFPHPEQIVAIQNQYKAVGLDSASASVADYIDYRKQRHLFSEVAAIDTGDFNLTGIDRPERLQCGVTTSGLFAVLGVQPIIGRVFSYDEDQPGRNNVVLLTQGLWKRRFGSDPHVVGRSIHLNGKPYTVVGVVPSILQWFAPLDAWIPTGFTAEDMSPSRRGNQFLFVVARLQPGVSVARARAGMAAFGATLAKSFPDEYPPTSGWAIRVDSLNELLVGDVRSGLIVLLAAVGFVLLIACANVANLLLARAAGRMHELSVRAALGAAKWRIARQLLTESVLLGLLGGAAGILLASWGVGLLVKYGPQQLPRLDEVTIDGRVLAFTAAIALITGMLFGLAPVLQVATGNLHDLLKLGARGAGSLRRHRTRSALVMVEVALSLVLLVSAGLLLRSLAGLQSVDPGFRAHNVLTFGVALPPAQYSTQARTSGFFQALLERVSALPGVKSAGAVNPLPFSGNNSSGSFQIEGQTAPNGGTAPHADQRVVSPDYFRAMGIPLRRGRLLTDADREGAPLAVIVDEALAQQYWKGADPIGQHLRRPSSKGPWATVVGVVGHVQHNALESQQRKATFYWSYLQMPVPSLEFVVRAAGDPMSLPNAVQHEVSALDQDVPVFDVRTMDQRVAGSLANRRFAVWLLAVFAGIALLLAAVGLYGVMAQTVLQRSREIGVRMALGAQSSDVLRMVLRQGIVLIGGGLLAGLAAALALTSLMKSLLFAVSPADPLTFVLVAVLLTAVALAATYLPARRATRVDPVTALRWE